MLRLVVNGDDFGLSDAVNAGILEAHARGILTSTSLMVRRERAADAVAAAAREAPRIGLGLHVDLGEWTYRDPDGWVAMREVAAERIEGEVHAQLALFRELCGRDPTHLDSHQHVHQREPARSVVLELGRALGVPVRHFDERVRYCGEFYGQTETGSPLPERITVDALLGVVERLAAPVTELCCHPAHGAVPSSSYDAERARELAALCDPRVATAVRERGISLISFESLA